MKKVLGCLLLLFSLKAQANITDSTDNAERTVREKILSDIQNGLQRKNHITDSTIAVLNVKLSNIDSIIKNTAGNKDRMDKLVERVKLLEDRQKAIEENELNVYEANYQSAIINVASMDREIKPLILFQSTKDFFQTLNEVSDLSSYNGYNDWFKGFKRYIEKNKKKDATLAAISNILVLGGDVSSIAPYGTITQLFCSGMAGYVGTIRNKDKELRKQSEKMFTLTMTLGQFNDDKDKIEYEWEGITQSLGDMQTYYDTVLNRNLQMIGCDKSDFDYHFVNEKDANRRYLYLSGLRKKAADLVAQYKNKEPKDWKDNIYYELADVQALRLKYGDITYHISEHIGKYDGLIKKYKADELIGPKVAILKTKLDDLKSTFDAAYEPNDYRNTAIRMYKVL